MSAITDANPELIERLQAAQRALHRPIDIVTFGYMAESREQLERHVTYYEELVKNQPASRARRTRRAA